MIQVDNTGDGIKENIGDLENTLQFLRYQCRKLDLDIEYEKNTAKTQAESDVAALTRRIRLLEEDLEQSSSRLNETLEKLEEASKLAEESERERKKNEGNRIAFETDLANIELLIKSSIDGSEEADRKYKEVQQKLESTKGMIEKNESLARQGESKITQLEAKLNEMAVKLKKLEIEKEKACEKEEFYDRNLCMLHSQIEEAEQIAKTFEQESLRRTSEISRFKQMLNQERNGYETLSKQLEQAMEEFRSA